MTNPNPLHPLRYLHTIHAALAWQQWLSLNWQLQAHAQTAVVRRDETLQGY